MLFSIITVTYNAEGTIEKTLKSLAEQTFSDYELIVVDGKSCDATLQKIEPFLEEIKNMHVFSEEDTGIYNAMNKGINKATGDFIYFLNSGDSFVDSSVLENTSSFIENYISENQTRENLVFHGNIMRAGTLRKFPLTYQRWKWVYLEHAYFSHQAIFASSNILKNSLYDESFKICADRDWFMGTMDKGSKYIYMRDIVIANYAEGGVSSNLKKLMEESLQISKKYGGNKAFYFVKLKRKVGEWLGHER